MKEDDSAYETTYSVFLATLRVLAADAHTACELMDNYNVAWELQHDTIDHGRALLGLWGDRFNEIQKEEIQNLILRISELPASALLTATSGDTNVIAMNDASWVPIREVASLLISNLPES